MSQATRSPWPAVALAVLAFGAWAWIHKPERVIDESSDAGTQREHQPAPPPVFPYAAEARALLGGLEPGEALRDGWVVERVEGPLPDRRIKVIAAREDASFAIWLVPTGQSQRSAPVASERWELFYDRPQPAQASVPGPEQVAVLELLADRIRTNEGRDVR
jgi:hypothetical protein